METRTAPALLEPPFAEPLLDAAGTISPAWIAWMTGLAGRVNVGNAAVTRAGPITSDATGHVSMTFDPPFLTAVVYVAIHDLVAGIAVEVVDVEADQEGFTGVLMSSSATLPDYTTNFWAVGY